MPIKVACPKCKNVLQVSSKMAGKSGKCKCGNVIKIPASTPTGDSAKSANAPTVGVAPKSAPASAKMFDELAESDFARRSPYEKFYESKGESTDAATLQRFTEEEVEAKQKKAGAAKGILKLISVIDVLAAFFCIAIIVFFAAMPDMNQKIAGFMPLVKLNQSLGIALFSVLSILFLVGAVGLFLSKAWGWIATGAIAVFIVIERIVSLVIVFKEGFNQAAFFGAGGPMLGALFLAMFVYRGDSQELCGIKTKIPMIVAILIGGVLGGAAAAALLSAGSAN